MTLIVDMGLPVPCRWLVILLVLLLIGRMVWWRWLLGRRILRLLWLLRLLDRGPMLRSLLRPLGRVGPGRLARCDPGGLFLLRLLLGLWLRCGCRLCR